MNSLRKQIFVEMLYEMSQRVPPPLTSSETRLYKMSHRAWAALVFRARSAHSKPIVLIESVNDARVQRA